jgi:hypothetical protein
VDWPSADAVAAAMLAYKARGETQVVSVASAPSSLAPAGYLRDIESAMYTSLLDDVFRLPGDLYGRRKADLTLWVRTLASTYPAATMRERLQVLAAQLQAQDTWAPDEYREMLRRWGAVEPAQTDASAWSWCAPSAAGAWGPHTHSHIIFLSCLCACVRRACSALLDARCSSPPGDFVGVLVFFCTCLMSTVVRMPADDVMRPSGRGGVTSGFRSRAETDTLGGGGGQQATAGTTAACGCCCTPCWPTRSTARPAACSAPCTCG